MATTAPVPGSTCCPFTHCRVITSYSIHYTKLYEVQFDTHCRRLPSAGETVSTWIRPVKLGDRALTFMSWFVSGDECLVENRQVVVFVRMLEQGYESMPILV